MIWDLIDRRPWLLVVAGLLMLLVVVVGAYQAAKSRPCFEQVPNPTCPQGTDLVVEDRVAVCRCQENR